jgi:8-oxo-dGTP diphosphatase
MTLSTAKTTEGGSKDDLANVLNSLRDINRIFEKTKNGVSCSHGIDCYGLKLGFGITKGLVGTVKLDELGIEEYLGERINLASRLCSLARPSGIIVDRESFPEIPFEFSDNFVGDEIKYISGFRERRVWLSREVKLDPNFESFESMEKNIEVHVTGLCFKKGMVLLAKRSSNRDIHPDKWSGPGGRVKKCESFEQALKRKFMEELDIFVNNIEFVKTYFIESHGIPGLIYKCMIDAGVPHLLSDENQDFQFFTQDELESIDMVPGLKSTARLLFNKM